MDQFTTTWLKYHPNSIPVSYTLAYGDLWQRFHSLPNSKRYAETDDEMYAILDRQNTLAEEVIGEGMPCWMIGYLHASDGMENGDEDWRQTHIEYFQLHNMPKVQYVPDPDDPEAAYDIFATKVIWRHGVFDEALRAIADDKLRVMWMSEGSGAIFAPYDGGVNLILPAIEDVQALVLSHSDWLSSYPGGY